MRTREKSKAQLLREMKDVEGAATKAWSKVNEARAERDAAMVKLAAVEKGVNELDRLYVSVTTRNTELEQQLSEVKARLEQWHHDAELYKQWFNKASRERDTARKALEHQALGIGRLTEHMEPREVADTCK